MDELHKSRHADEGDDDPPPRSLLEENPDIARLLTEPMSSKPLPGLFEGMTFFAEVRLEKNDLDAVAAEYGRPFRELGEGERSTEDILHDMSQFKSTEVGELDGESTSAVPSGDLPNDGASSDAPGATTPHAPMDQQPSSSLPGNVPTPAAGTPSAQQPSGSNGAGALLGGLAAGAAALTGALASTPATPVCPACGKEGKPGSRFCRNCGVALTVPAPAPPQPVVPVCPACGKEVKPGARFCRNCGGALAPSAAVISPPTNPVPTAPPPVAPVAVLPPPVVSVPSGLIPPPPPPIGFPVAGVSAAPPPPPPGTAPAEVFDLPAGTEPWPFQTTTTEFARKTIESLKKSGLNTDTDFGRIVVRLIRAALLDTTIYREVCADPLAAKESRLAMAGLIAVNSLVPLFLSFGSLSMGTLISVLVSAVVQAIGWYARAWVVQLVAANWLKRDLAYAQVFRPLVYAQAPTALGFIPVLGQLIGLWSLVTNTAAIRDVTGCKTAQAVGLSVAGYAGVMVCGAVVAPIVAGLFRFIS